MASNEDSKLAAPCGLYCGACIDHLVHKNCHGCGSAATLALLQPITSNATSTSVALNNGVLKPAANAKSFPALSSYNSATTPCGSIILQLSKTCGNVKPSEQEDG